jgi:hypothetical protein
MGHGHRPTEGMNQFLFSLQKIHARTVIMVDPPKRRVGARRIGPFQSKGVYSCWDSGSGGHGVAFQRK